MNDTIYISLESLARKLRLPQKYLREQAKSGNIPSLNVVNRLRFQEQSVRDALSKLSEKPKSNQAIIFENLIEAKDAEDIFGILKSRRDLSAVGISVEFAGVG